MRHGAEELLAAIRLGQQAIPSMRTMQLIVNATDGDPFYVDDARAAVLIREYIQYWTSREAVDGGTPDGR